MRERGGPTALCNVLACPNCRLPLHGDGKVFACSQRHSFDIAREGYVNLLAGKGSGDAAEMLAARRRILEAGHYAPATEAVADITISEARNGSSITRTQPIFLDAGCGEGHYLRRIASELDDVRVDGYRYIGLDSSRYAIKMAASASREHFFVVADVKRVLPFADSSVAVLLSTFAPRNPAEFARVVASGGALIAVIPQPNHLAALSKVVPMLGMEENKEEHLRDALGAGFALQSEHSVEWQMNLSGEEVVDLVRMTPSYWHLSPEDREKLNGTRLLSVEGKVRALLFRRW